METNRNEIHHFLNNMVIQNLLYTLMIAFLPLVLIVGGAIILISKMPGWSLILGLPMVVIGVVFLIYAYDEAVTRKLEIKYHIQDKLSDKDRV